VGIAELSARADPEFDRGVRDRWVAGEVPDQAVFVDQRLRRGQISSEHLVASQEVDRETATGGGAPVPRAS
jgi:hypothetical protein